MDVDGFAGLAGDGGAAEVATESKSKTDSIAIIDRNLSFSILRLLAKHHTGKISNVAMIKIVIPGIAITAIPGQIFALTLGIKAHS